MLSREERARQFLPFNALKGFNDALKEKEIEYVEKVELSEDCLNEISEILNLLEVGIKVKIKYYHHKQYIEIKGNINYIDSIKKKILVDNVLINFADILKIVIL